MAIRIGLWDCESCGHKGNHGPSTRCEKCGAPRPENVKFYLPENAGIVTDKNKINEAKAGADWICAFCGAHNKITSDVCSSCGASKKDQGQLKTLAVDKNQPEKPAKNSKTKTAKVLKFIAFAFIIFMIFALIGYIKTETVVTLTQKNWERSFSVDKYGDYTEQGWTLPENAVIISKEYKFHYNDKVIDHYETKTRTVKVKVGERKYVCGQKDLGNGYFEDVYCTEDIYENKEETYQEPVYKNVPVYDTFYVYKVSKWKFWKKFTETGKNTTPEWASLPDSVVNNPDYKFYDSIEKYSFTLKFKNQNITENKIPPDLFSKYNVNDEIPAYKSKFFGYYLGLKELEDKK